MLGPLLFGNRPVINVGKDIKQNGRERERECGGIVQSRDDEDGVGNY